MFCVWKALILAAIVLNLHLANEGILQKDAQKEEVQSCFQAFDCLICQEDYSKHHTGGLLSEIVQSSVWKKIIFGKNTPDKPIT